MPTPMYTSTPFGYRRRQTWEVAIGDVPLGASNPIRVQSMTTTNTLDTDATVSQSIKMIEAGCEYVRITAPSINEANNLALIKKGLKDAGFTTPLIADIHFTPNAAEVAARIVEKVRINPGNYIDKKKFDIREYSDLQYEEELERLQLRFTPLVKICKEHGTAMRIGTNHGSLSDRILNRYGDTPLGMVESALEFLRVCEDLSYRQVVLSMKASNPLVMISAYRLLVARLDELGWHYPLHLGVTEAGEASEGRIKSAMGIGALLEDGLGDTIRVSLTEPPEEEMPVAIAIAKPYLNKPNDKVEEVNSLAYDPYSYTRRPTRHAANIGGKEVPRVVADLSRVELFGFQSLGAVGHTFHIASDKWYTSDTGADYIYRGAGGKATFMLPLGTGEVVEDLQASSIDPGHLITSLTWEKWNALGTPPAGLHFIRITTSEITEEALLKISSYRNSIIVLAPDGEHSPVHAFRKVYDRLLSLGIGNPVILHLTYSGDVDEAILRLSIDAGSLFADGFGDGLMVSYREENLGNEQLLARLALINDASFYVLQAARLRISRTEYISCPSCGRTLFDLQETTGTIRASTDHLKGVKIAIMGCIVNGPGEMADADYGYVGTGPDKITLYRGRDVVSRNIPSTQALPALIDLIKEDGLWLERGV